MPDPFDLLFHAVLLLVLVGMVGLVVEGRRELRRLHVIVDRLAPVDPPPFLSIGDAAQALGIGRSTLYEAIARGEVRTVTIGRRRLVARSELDRLAAGDG